MYSHARKCSNLVSPVAIGNPEFASRRVNRLKHLLSRLVLAHPGCFNAHGQQFELPYRCEQPVMDGEKPLDDKQIRRMVTFFGSNGNLAVSRDFTSTTLTITQTCGNADWAKEFADVFGGPLIKCYPSYGAESPTVRWCVTGAKARRAASVLGSFASPRQKALQAVASAKSISKTDKVRLAANIKIWKNDPPPLSKDHIATWEQAGALFDSNCCVLVTTPFNGNMRLGMVTKHRDVLESFKHFLESNGFAGGDVHSWKENSWEWRLYGISRCKPIIRSMLPYVSARQAEIVNVALELERHNLVEIRTRIKQLRMKYSNTRIFHYRDAYTDDLFRLRHNVCQRYYRLLRRTKLTPEIRASYEKDLEEIRVKRQQHVDHHVAIHMRKYIRDFLDKGAVLRSR